MKCFYLLKMNILNIPKDVIVEVLKKLSLRELIDTRLLNKHFNNIVKEKFKRLWFKKYIDVMTRTGEYGKKYDVPVKKHHVCHVYIKEIDLKIPYVTCYCVTQSELKNKHEDEFKEYFNEATTLKKTFKNENVVGTYSNSNEPCSFSGADLFEHVYAYTKLIANHYSIICSDKAHYQWDIPSDENDEKWFDSHEIIYDKNKCYLSAYLFACYRVKRDDLDKTGKIKGDKGYIRGKMKEQYKDSPFYNRMLKTYKCI